ncbi:hypothetical protein GGI24_002847 [Coemansia furcata]|nr:hypothetical protein GGI24_002847 [Coemansia furcata]
MGKRVKTTLSTSASSIWNQPHRTSCHGLSAWFADKRQRGGADDPKAMQPECFSPESPTPVGPPPTARRGFPSKALSELSLPPAEPRDLDAAQADAGLFMNTSRHIVILDSTPGQANA